MGKFLVQLRAKNLKYAAFVTEYCTGEVRGKKYNATSAAIVAGYAESGAHVRGSALMKRDDVKAAVQELLGEISMQAEEIVARLSDIARAEIGNIVDIMDNGQIRMSSDELKKLKPFIKSFSWDSNGNPKIEFHDPHAAIKDLARIRGLNKDGLELTGANGGPIQVQLNINFHSPQFIPEAEFTTVGELNPGTESPPESED
jgi:hypothetical protein